MMARARPRLAVQTSSSTSVAVPLVRSPSATTRLTPASTSSRACSIVLIGVSVVGVGSRNRDYPHSEGPAYPSRARPLRVSDPITKPGVGTAPESVRRSHGPYEGDGLGSEARCGSRSAPPPPESLEAGAVPAKKRLRLDDAQHVPPGRRDGSERDQGVPVQPRHARPGDRALQHGELVSEQGDLREQRPTRAKGGRHGGDEHEHGLEHERAKVVPIPLDFSPIREVAITPQVRDLPSAPNRFHDAGVACFVAAERSSSSELYSVSGNAMTRTARKTRTRSLAPKLVPLPPEVERSIALSDPSNAVPISKEEVDRWAETGELPNRIETWLASSPSQRDTRKAPTRSGLG